MAITTRQVYLHIGVPKSGTTALQQTVFMPCEEVLYLGKPLTTVFRRVGELICGIIDPPEDEWTAGLALFCLRMAPLFAAPSQCVVISEEEFSCGSQVGSVSRSEIAKRLHLLFPNARVLLVLRNQLTALQSLYAYAMTIPGTSFVPFNAWLNEQREALPHSRGFEMFDYADLMDVYAGRFGRERIEVFFHEDFSAHHSEFVARLARILGIDETFTRTIENLRMNTRPSLRMVRAMHFRGSRPWVDQVIERLPPILRRKLVEAVASGPALDVSYGSEEEAFVRAYYANGNRRLAEVYGVDIRAADYPC